jgi:uncharacterized coiled-coil protein SlyX
MDVEKTIEFILAMEARTEARLDKLAERQDRFANDLATLAAVVRDEALMVSETNDSVRRLGQNSLRLHEDAAQLREYSEGRWSHLEEMSAKNSKDLEELRKALERHLPKDQSS